jgi:hypothetical protein
VWVSVRPVTFIGSIFVYDLLSIYIYIYIYTYMYRREIKSRIAMAKAAFNKKKTLFTSKLDLNLRMKLVKCYIWSIALYGAGERWRRSVGQIV